MATLTTEQVVTTQVSHRRGQPATQAARLLGATEGTVRYRRRAREGADDGRRRPSQVGHTGLAEAVERWWRAQAEALGEGRPPGVPLLHDYLPEEYGYRGSDKSVRKFARARFGKPRLRPSRRAETPPGAQTQSDWGEFRGVEPGDPEGPAAVYAVVMARSHSRERAVVRGRTTDQPAWHRVHNGAHRRLGGVAAVNRTDDLKAGVARGCGAWGTADGQYRVYARARGFHVDACEVRCPEPRGKTGRRVGVWKRLPVRPGAFDGLAGLQAWTGAALEAGEARRVCPATGLTAAEGWAAERPLLRPLPARLPEPLDPVRTAAVHEGCTVNFEGHSCVAPFAYAGRGVAVRGCSGSVQVLDPGTAAVLASYPRHTAELTLSDPTCYEGHGTDRVVPPEPLGRMARRLAEIAAPPVPRRPVDLYAAPAEVARGRPRGARTSRGRPRRCPPSRRRPTWGCWWAGS